VIAGIILLSVIASIAVAWRENKRQERSVRDGQPGQPPPHDSDPQPPA
jgi:hypothetical protein